MSTPMPGDYDPWKEVTILWDHGATTRTNIRRSEIAAWLGTLPMERIVVLSFGSPPDTEEGRTTAR